MADSSASATPGRRDLRRPVVQVAGAWAAGSIFLGTAALLFLTSQHLLFGPGSGAEPLWACGPTLPGFCRSLAPLLTPLEWLGACALVALLFGSLAVLLWRTAAATWLVGDIRARLLWIMVVGLGGLAGWLFAAAVTFAVQFSPATQAILAYTVGGLPFGLMAAMLLRQWRVNVLALTLAAGFVAAGFLVVAEHSPAPQNVFIVHSG